MNKDKNQICPYIGELLGFLFIVGAMLYGSISGLIAESPIFLFVCTFVVVAWLIQYIYSFAVFSVQALIDLIRKDYCRENALFREQYVLRADSLLDKVIYEKMKKGKGKYENIRRRKDEEMKQTFGFKIIVKTKDGIKVLTSSSYFDLKEHHHYEFVYGRRSGTLIDVIALEENVQ